MRLFKFHPALRRLCAVALCAALCLTPLSAWAEEPASPEPAAVHLATAGDVLRLAEDCALDTWSAGRTVVLDGDLDLSGVPFSGIPFFDGTFDGQGHTIRGLSIRAGSASRGLFRYLGKNAVVQDLTVQGTVAPGKEESRLGLLAGTNRGTILRCAADGTVFGGSDVGGLAGLNESTGVIQECTARGVVYGQHFTGGVVGTNRGVLQSCTNAASVNTTSEQNEIDLGSLTVADFFSTESASTITDIGGIAGKNAGVLQNCENRGTVGYQHIGYNIGGIAGSQTGYLTGCVNTGAVFGRKEVGGIVGQMEPSSELEYTQSLLQTLQGELTTLNGLVDTAITHAGGTSSALGTQFSNLQGNISGALGAVETLMGQAADNVGQLPDLLPATLPADPVLPDPFPQPSEPSGGEAPSETPSTPETPDSDPPAPQPEVPETPDVPDTSAPPEEPAPAAPQAPVPQPEAPAPQPEAAPPEAPAADQASSFFTGSPQFVFLGTQDTPDPAWEWPGSLPGGLPDNWPTDLPSSGDILPDPKDQITHALQNGAEQVSAQLTAGKTALSGCFAGISSSLSAIHALANQGSSTLQQDVRAISDQIQVIADSLTSAQPAGDVLEDVSDEDTEADTAGKVAGCRNRGPVTGDRNVGGITGAMAYENALDPEDDRKTSGADSVTFVYKSRVVARDCANEGTVTAKKDNAGGIAGSADLGSIISCTNEAPVASEDGTGVGGITGSARAVIRESSAKCELSGKSQVGGIAGSASQLSGCRAMVRITGGKTYSGSIAGKAAAEGAFAGNYFVADGVPGIDGVSYSGQAEPLPYETFLALADLPEFFRTLHVTFVAGDQMVKTLAVPYGGSVEAAQIPAVPQQDGVCAQWEDFSRSGLTFDRTVHAVYTPYRSTLDSSMARNDKPLLLAEGSFGPEDHLTMAPQEGISLPAGALSGQCWDYALPQTSAGRHKLRYLAPEDAAACEIYLWQDGAWHNAGAVRDGSYWVFEADAAGTFCVTAKDAAPFFLLPLLGALAAAALVLLGWWLRRRKRRRAAAHAA